MQNFMKKLKVHYYLIIILLILLYHNTFINILSNINSFTKSDSDVTKAENKILKTENITLKEELANVTSLKPYAKYNYSLTRLSYREVYNSSVIYIRGGLDKNYAKGNALINEKGLVGIISEVYDTYSKATLIYDIDNFSIKINDSYGSITSYDGDLLLVKNISNYDNIHLNDEVYTSSLGILHESLYIGYVKKIEEHDISKDIYIKTDVDFNNLSYMYVVGE